MYANNEVGTINPIPDIAAVAAKHGVLFHSDAVQGIGQLPSNMEALGLDLASLTAHKIYVQRGSVRFMFDATAHNRIRFSTGADKKREFDRAH